MKKSIVAMAGACMLCVGAHAQDLPGGVSISIDPAQIRHIYVDQHGRQSDTPPYTDRAVGVTHDGLNGATQPVCAVFLNQAAAPQTLVSILEDVSFTPGPWSATTTNHIREVQVPLGNNTTVPANYDLRIRFWAAGDVSYTNNPMIRNGATPLRELPVAVRNIGQGFFTVNLTLAAAQQFDVTGNRVFVQLEAFQPGSTTDYFTGTQIVFWAISPNGFSTPPVGSTDISMGFDRNRNGIFAGGAPGATAEHGQLAFGAAGACANQRIHLGVRIRGDVPATPPATFMDLGTLTDAPAPMAMTVPAAGLKWFRFRLGNDVSDAARRFLDLDTENSAITDTAMALYNNVGDLLRDDADDGSGDLAHLSFGVGRRAAASAGGKQFDGTDGQLAATEPFFWLAVASGPTEFRGGFEATSTGTGGSATLNIRSNVVSGTLEASVAPAGEDVLVDLGDVTAPGVPGTATMPGAFGVLWYKFNVCQDLTPGGTLTLDIDFSNNDQLGDTEAFIFNAAGNQVATSDDADADGMEPVYVSPQFSWGATSSPRPAIHPDAQAFAGQDGALARGTYYMAVSFFNTITLDTMDRWHVRVLNGSDLAIRPDFLTNIADCTARCVADVDDGTFTGTPDGGVTIDDLLYYVFIFGEGNVAADVDDGTFTGTRDGGVTIDDLLYFVFRFSEGC